LPEVERAGRFSPTWQHAVGLDDVLMAWADLASARIVNRPAAMAMNSSKPYQAGVIRRSGFDVPATLMTTDPDAVREFHLDHGEVIYKSLSGVRSIVSRLDAKDSERLGRVRWCPTQFQQYIDGVDWRVHVIGEDVFGCEVLSDADDYRYAARQGHTVELRPVDVPDDVAERCVSLTHALGLDVSGVDLRRDREGRWYCFEVNPSPAFSYYQRGTGQPIDAAIAAFLMSNEGDV
jgi:glutathione synthase/RimK-type ligase-like ATP-grasp enzyme